MSGFPPEGTGDDRPRPPDCAFFLLFPVPFSTVLDHPPLGI